MSKQEVFQIELNEKERYMLWIVATFFSEPMTSTVKAKLFPGDRIRKKYDAKGVDRLLENRLMDYGSWLKEYYAKQEGRLIATRCNRLGHISGGDYEIRSGASKK